jgi:hypothetical protein
MICNRRAHDQCLFAATGLAPDKFTSAFVLVLAVPDRRAARIATTTSCTACEPRPPSTSSILASFAAALVKTFALMIFWPVS